jgi:hypothetical protein
MHIMQNDVLIPLIQIALHKRSLKRRIDIDDSFEYVKDLQGRHCAPTPFATFVIEDVHRLPEILFAEPKKNPVPVRKRHITNLQVKEWIPHKNTENIMKEQAERGCKDPSARKE